MPTKSEPIDELLLQLYTSGNCSPEQLKVIQRYLKEPAYKKSLESWMLQHWMQFIAGEVLPEADDQQAYQVFHAVTQPKARGRLVRMRQWAAVAAMLLLLASGFVLWQRNSRGSALLAREQHWVAFRNDTANVRQWMLPDSSVVYLGAASELKYNGNFGLTNRLLLLKGEAYFIARHGGAYPFSVNTGAITTVDVGTAFNIRYRLNEAAINVAVAEGEVLVTDQAEASKKPLAALHASEQLSFNRTSGALLIEQLSGTEGIGSWRQGILVFEEKLFHEVGSELERRYGVVIHFNKPATRSIRITTVIDNVGVKEALDIVCFTAGVSYRKTGKDIYIQ